MRLLPLLISDFASFLFARNYCLCEFEPIDPPPFSKFEWTVCMFQAPAQICFKKFLSIVIRYHLLGPTYML